MKKQIQKQLQYCQDMMRDYAAQQYHCESELQYIARRMGLSIQQCTRIRRYFDCIPEIQEMIQKDLLGLSCTDQIAYKTTDQQKRIYELLQLALLENTDLARDRIVVPVAAMIAEDSSVSWNEVRPQLHLLQKTPRIKRKKNNPNSTYAIGKRFVQKIVTCLRANGYPDAEVNPKQVHDYKCDASATDLQGRKLVFQFKYHRPGKNEGCKAVEEALQAKLNYGADIALASFIPHALRVVV